MKNGDYQVSVLLSLWKIKRDEMIEREIFLRNKNLTHEAFEQSQITKIVNEFIKDLETLKT